MGFLNNLLSIIFPEVCEVCGHRLVEGEQHICLECLATLPRLSYHTNQHHPFVKRMAAAKIYKTAVMFAYVKHSSCSRLIRIAKYNHRPEIDRTLAKCFAAELGAPFFADIDIILPVPMHWRKRLFRGFNQTDFIAQGVSSVTNIPVGDNLVAVRGHSTQTHRSAVERMKNTVDIFDICNAEELEGKHILIVDDVITTGATILSCADAIRSATSEVKVSVLALAAARQD